MKELILECWICILQKGISVYIFFSLMLKSRSLVFHRVKFVIMARLARFILAEVPVI